MHPLQAGLFSAAVTAFVVESYQWLDDSSDETANLLSQLISIQFNGTITPVAAKSFTPSPSAIRINICWFFSLVLSLTSVLVSNFCLQWLREYERPVATTFKDKLRYRQIRYDGLVAWKVPESCSSPCSFKLHWSYSSSGLWTCFGNGIGLLLSSYLSLSPAPFPSCS